MITPTKVYQPAEKVKIELPSKVLAQLLKSGLLHGNECKCLDINAKKVLWKLLLASSLKVEPVELA